MALLFSSGIAAAAPDETVDGPLKLSLLEAVSPSPDSPLYLQVVNPADKMREGGSATMTRPASGGLTATGVPAPARLRSFELPAVEVVGQRPAELKEEELVGPAGQPRWTTDRRFPGTRIYVIPEGVLEAEFWLRPTSPRHGATAFRTLWELEFGLPHRFQLDLYFRTESTEHGDAQIGQSIEIRYALADWGKIWGNPTIYLEWARMEDEPDAVEFKLLLGGEIAPRWHWGINLSDELATGGDRANEIELTAGISYTLEDSKFSVGAEMEMGFVDTHGRRGSYDEKFLFVGPSIQYRPYESIHIDFAPMVGIPLAGDSPRFRAYFVIGYEF
jgi:hypothetical protein